MSECGRRGEALVVPHYGCGDSGGRPTISTPPQTPQQFNSPIPKASLVLLFLSSLPSAFPSSAYDILSSYGFPSGLLPQTVSHYDLDSDGKFTLYLSGSCTVDIPDAYPVKYAPKITGTISNQTLDDLSGITVKVLFVWWDITGISVSGDDLVFKVGPVSASYAALNFSENPVCEEGVSEEQFPLQVE